MLPPAPEGVEIKSKVKSQKIMNWRKITKDTQEPDTEVLAIGYQNECIVGWLGYTEGEGWVCDAGDQELNDVKAFVPISEVVYDFKGSK